MKTVLVRLLFLFTVVILLYVFNAFLNPIPKKQNLNCCKPLYGTTFSFEQAGWYGLSPHDSYIKLLDNFKFNWIRLPYFWDQDNTSDIEFAVVEAKKRDINVIIALGAKTPYYPEYHLPLEIRKQLSYGQQISMNSSVSSEILKRTEEVVKKLSKYENITYWQVENEPLIGNVNRWKLDYELITREVDVVRNSDPLKRPVILNHAATGFYDNSWKKLLLILKPGDVFGVNAYFKTQGINLFDFNIFGKEVFYAWPRNFNWPVQSWLFISPDFGKIKMVVEKQKLDIWVLEMQAEPYIRNNGDFDRANYAFSPSDIEKGNDFLRSYGIKSIGLWGVHFWQYKESKGDSRWEDAVKNVLSENN